MAFCYDDGLDFVNRFLGEPWPFEIVWFEPPTRWERLVDWIGF